jgi:hypothetical protein
MSLLLNRQPTRKAKPVSGTCKWVLPIGEVGTGVLSINGVSYTTTVLKDQDRVTGYRLQKFDGMVYDIDASREQWGCDCPDATYRERECKHVKALRAALAVAGQQ